MPEDLPRAARAEYLTDALRRAGALGAGRVRDVVVESSKPTILSRIIRIRLSYDGPAADAPASLILKTAGTCRCAKEPRSVRSCVLHAGRRGNIGGAGAVLL